MAKATCSIDGCDRPSQSRGWCRSHYMNWYERGAPGTGPIKLYDSSRVCIVDGCDKPYAARGWCAPHHKRVMANGDPGPAEIKPRSVGDAANYQLAHLRIRKARGPAKDQQCLECGNAAHHWAYDHTDPNEKSSPTGLPYSLDVNRYAPMCARCHKRADMKHLRDLNPAVVIGLNSKRRP